MTFLFLEKAFGFLFQFYVVGHPHQHVGRTELESRPESGVECLQKIDVVYPLVHRLQLACHVDLGFLTAEIIISVAAFKLHSYSVEIVLIFL